MTPDVIQSVPTGGSSKVYLINMSFPYEKGNIEGGPFYLQWVSIIFQLNIHVSSSLAKNIVNYYIVDSNSD
jgi:hypothetical protein